MKGDKNSHYINTGMHAIPSLKDMGFKYRLSIYLSGTVPIAVQNVEIIAERLISPLVALVSKMIFTHKSI